MANLGQLASDDSNTAFQGAHNPDDLLHVRFYERALRNNFQSENQGRPIFDNVIFTEIHTPGNQLNIIDRPKQPRDEMRFPRQWAHFKNTHSDDPAKQGTPLAQWPLIDVAKAEMLKAMKFFTVEQIAFASDEQIGKLGMLAGMAPLSFRDKAKAYLTVAKDANAVGKAEEDRKAMEAKFAESEAKHKEEVDALNAKLNAILERMAAPVVPTEAPKERKKYVMTEEHKAKLKAAREKKG